MDLTEKLHHNTKSNHRKSHEHKRQLRPSLTERPKAVDEHNTFGHWEIDTVISAKHKHGAVLLILAEGQTRGLKSS
ncbi:hypothetical protein [Salinicoccus roseus]|uniref:hypothetical protein n=1 Tax=Salinicoccus roseus TaxID=45670 RepID=UPI0023007208|nr:hypothetical protein [Salinicoccus roseus]